MLIIGFAGPLACRDLAGGGVVYTLPQIISHKKFLWLMSVATAMQQDLTYIEGWGVLISKGEKLYKI